jgi:hypothetical protein
MKNLFCLFLLTLSISANAQVSVNNDNSLPDNSAMLDVKSTVKGILVPRMTAAEMLLIPTPATGLMVYNTTGQAFYNYSGTAWVMLAAGSANILKDTDGDTKIVVEKTSDEDIIHFSLAGTEKMTLMSNRLEFADRQHFSWSLCRGIEYDRICKYGSRILFPGKQCKRTKQHWLRILDITGQQYR